MDLIARVDNVWSSKILRKSFFGSSIHHVLSSFCIKGSKWFSENILNTDPGEDSEDGLDEEGQEEECVGIHQGNQNNCYKGYNL